jgi:hypothetical protein
MESGLMGPYLWLGHESIQTTHGYIEADLAIKSKLCRN